MVFYKCDDFYNAPAERGIKYDDPQLNIDWRISREHINVSNKDAALPLFREAEMNFYAGSME